MRRSRQWAGVYTKYYYSGGYGQVNENRGNGHCTQIQVGRAITQYKVCEMDAGFDVCTPLCVRDRRSRVHGLRPYAVRATTMAVALGAAEAWTLLPLRDDLASVTPARVAMLTCALMMLCLVMTAAALTRRGDPGSGRVR